MAPRLWLNEQDIWATYGLRVQEFTGFPGLPNFARKLQPISGPQIEGAYLDPQLLTTQPAPAKLILLARTANLSAASTLADKLSDLFGGEEVTVRTGARPDRYCVFTAEGCHVLRLTRRPEYVAIEVTGLVRHGCAWSTTETTVNLSTSAAACPTGTFQSLPVIRIWPSSGTITNPTIIQKDKDGATVNEMQFSTATLSGGVLGAADKILVYADGSRITVSLSGGAEQDQHILLTSGDFPTLKPKYAAFASSSWQTLALSASAGTPVGDAVYRKRYR